MMLRSFALYAALRARHSRGPTGPARPTSQAMLSAVAPTPSLIQAQDVCPQAQLPIAMQHSPLACFTASLLGAALSLHITRAHAHSTAAGPSQHSTATEVTHAARQPHSDGRSVQARCLHAGAQDRVQAYAMQHSMHSMQASSTTKHSGQGAARHVMQQMSLAMQRKDLDTVLELFDMELIQQATRPVAINMVQLMLRVHVMRGEGLQAVALLKGIRAAGLPITTAHYTLMLQAFCRVGALQDAVLHIQCNVPADCVDTFMVNGILIAALQAQQHDLIMQQCLDILDERGLAWDATTWRQVFRLQAKSHNVEDVMHAKSQLDQSPFARNPEVHTAYIRALCTCNSLNAAVTALHHLLWHITPASGSPQPTAQLQHSANPQFQHGSAPLCSPSANQLAPGGSNPLPQEAARDNQQQLQPQLQPTASSQSSGASQLAAAASPTATLQYGDSTQSAAAAAALSSRPHWRSWVDAELDSCRQPLANRDGQADTYTALHSQQSSAQPMGAFASTGSQDRLQRAGDGLLSNLGSQASVPQQPQRWSDGDSPSWGLSSGLTQQQLRLIQEACHTVMTVAERQQQHGLVLPILESMKQAGIESDTAIQNSVMRVAKQQGQSSAQLEAYLVQLRQLGLQPDEQTFNVLLRAYVADQDLQAASDILQRMVEDGVLPGRYTFNAMMEAYAGSGDMQGTAAVFAEMKQHGIKPDHCTFIALFMAVKNHFEAARHAAGGDRAQQDWKHKQMLDREGISEQLHEWVADMRAAGLRHTDPSLTALIQAYGHLMEFTHMMHLLRAASTAPKAAETSPTPARPNLRTYNAAISALCRVGHLTRALRLEHEMVAAGVAPNVHTFTSLISACGFKRQLQTCNQLWDHMLETGVEPNLYTYNARVKAECIVGDFDAAFDTIADMVQSQPQPDSTTWQTILAAAHRFERSDVVQRVAQHAPQHTTMYTSEPQRAESPNAAKGLTLPMGDTEDPSAPSQSAQPELLTADEMEAGGWSSGFDDSDDDIIGGSF